MKTVARGSSATTRRASKRSSQSIFAPARRAPCEATKRPCTWKIGSAWISTSPPSAGVRQPQYALQRDGVREQVAVRQHRPLAAPGGAARVEDRGEVVARALRRRVPCRRSGGPFEQAAAAIVAEGEDEGRSGGERELGRPDEVLRRADEDGGLGVADEVADLVALVGGVERQVDVAGAQHGQVEEQRLDRLLDLHRDPLAAAGRANRAGWRASPSPARGRARCRRGRSRSSRSRRCRGRRERRPAARRRALPLLIRRAWHPTCARPRPSA